MWPARIAVHIPDSQGHAHVVELLLLEGASVELRDGDGRTPLHWAALGGHTAAIVCIIDFLSK
jgi:ankyrin repeat protein